MTSAVVDTHGLIWYLEDSPLISRDRKIQLSQIDTIW